MSWHQTDPIVAIDFETADRGRDSACAIAVVRVEGDQIVRSEVRFIRPPRPQIEFTHVHGLTWEDVAGAPAFAEVWAELRGCSTACGSSPPTT